MSDRLQELLRQRASIQAHLAWLDREIAAAQPPSVPTPSLPAATAPADPSPAVPIPLASTSVSAAPEAEAEAILASYRQDTTVLRTDLRKGCLLYFFGALALVALVVAVFYFISTRVLHPAPKPAPAVEQPPSIGR